MKAIQTIAILFAAGFIAAASYKPVHEPESPAAAPTIAAAMPVVPETTPLQDATAPITSPDAQEALQSGEVSLPTKKATENSVAKGDDLPPQFHGSTPYVGDDAIGQHDSRVIIPHEAQKNQFSSIALDMLAENNRVRLAYGWAAQSLDQRLCAAAQEQADCLAYTGQFSHHVNGTPRTRAAKHGFPVRDINSLEVRENLAGDFQSVTNAFLGWCQSPGHFANILSDCDVCGFGYAKGRNGNVWCAVYGKESPETFTAPTQQPVARYVAPVCIGGQCYPAQQTRYVPQQSYAAPSQSYQYSSYRSGPVRRLFGR